MESFQTKTALFQSNFTEEAVTTAPVKASPPLSGLNQEPPHAKCCYRTSGSWDLHPPWADANTLLVVPVKINTGHLEFKSMWQ